MKLFATFVVAAVMTFAVTFWLSQDKTQQSDPDNAADSASDFSPSAPGEPAPPSMVWIPGGEFIMGSEHPLARPDERPLHRVRVDGFWMDTIEVTNTQFGEFINATGYVTTAERKPNLEEIMSQRKSHHRNLISN